MGVYTKRELDKFEQPNQFIPPYRSKQLSLSYRLLLFFFCVSIPFLTIFTPSPIYHNDPHSFGQTFFGSWIITITIITNLIGLLNYCIISDSTQKNIKDPKNQQTEAITKVYMHFFGLNYSLVFMNTIMWWIFERNDFQSYYSIGLYSIFLNNFHIFFIRK